MPSIWEEPAGRVILEAEAMEVPVVASNSGGIPEYLNESSALVIEKDEFFIENLAKSIEELVEDTEKNKNMGRNGRKYAEIFTAERYYKEILSIIRSET